MEERWVFFSPSLLARNEHLYHYSREKGDRQSDVSGRLYEELKTVDLENLRAVCKQHSRTQWTAIASRERLYQFVAMSDEMTQMEMCRDLGTVDARHAGSSSRGSSQQVGTGSPSAPRGVKRYVR
jgi:hypothetical protein